MMKRHTVFTLAAGMMFCGLTTVKADDLSGEEPIPSAPAPQAEQPGPAVPAVVDLLPNHFDPFNPGMIRPPFLRAAGVDLEMDKTEFDAAVAAGTGVVFRFDRWEDMLRFDQNGNGRIDWFEFQAYRTDTRTRLLAAFDRNGDGRLSGAEREQANRALAAGRLPGRAEENRRGGPGREMDELADLVDGLIGPEGGPARPGRGGARPGREGGDAAGGEMMRQLRDVGRQLRELQRRYDPEGTGEMTDEQRRAMWSEAAEMIDGELMRRLDADGDGVISEEEMRAAFRQAREEFGRQAEQARQAFIERWDTDGDGVLSPEEMRAARDAMIEERLMRRYAPDGNPTEEQQAQIEAALARMQERAEQMERRMAEARERWNERFRNEDGSEMTQEQRAEAIERMREQMRERAEEARRQWNDRFRNEDGSEMTEEQRAAAREQMREEMRERMRQWQERRRQGEEAGPPPARGGGRPGRAAPGSEI